MSTVVPFLLLGLLLGVLLAVWARGQSEPSAFETEDVSGPEHALESLRLELLPPVTVNSLLSRSDWDFVRGATPNRIQRVFLRERTRLVLFWLGETRRQMIGLMRLHRGLARSLKDISPVTEAGLALRYAAFLMGCNLVRLAVLLWDPFRVRGVLVRCASGGRNLCTVFERFFAAHEHGPARLKVVSPSRF